jgi:uncharacterized protein YdhG (YjbR/CyaY superfamily)
MGQEAAATVDAYIAAQPAAAQPVLNTVRATIRAALPEAREGIAYKMPAYRMDGRHAVYFAGWKKHWALYPLNDAIRTRFAAELAEHEVEKDTVRFSWTTPVPAELVAALAKAIAGP